MYRHLRHRCRRIVAASRPGQGCLLLRYDHLLIEGGRWWVNKALRRRFVHGSIANHTLWQHLGTRCSWKFINRLKFLLLWSLICSLLYILFWPFLIRGLHTLKAPLCTIFSFKKEYSGLHKETQEFPCVLSIAKEG